MKLAHLTAILLLSVSSSAAEDRVIGLLTLPEVFGNGPCHEFAPEEVPLYSAIGADEPQGVIRVDRYWKFPDAGGCEGLIVNAQKGEEQSISALPTEEFDYEAPAAIVLEEQNDWFKLQLSDGTAWVRVTERNKYYPLVVLLLNGLTYIAENPASQIFSHPGGDDTVATAASGNSVRALEAESVDNQLWLHIQVLSHSVCESVDEPRLLSQGWIRAHDPSGRPTVWFYSRGC
jgi:hypothetical protein